jgi:hypothetical protein
MGTMNTRTESLHVTVQVRPKGAGPYHWPHHVVEEGRIVRVAFDWATIQAEAHMDDGELVMQVTGYSLGEGGLGDLLPWRQVEGVIDAWFDARDDESWQWEFRLVVPTEVIENAIGKDPDTLPLID